MAELSFKNSPQVKAVNYFRKKATSQAFGGALNTPLHLLILLILKSAFKATSIDFALKRIFVVG